MRILALILLVLVIALLAEGLFDSVVAAWTAVVALFSLVAVKLAGSMGIWPDDWPDIFGDGD